jgi:D-arabinose 1-dehydrogenase-like Zn-dependent alcohol dehydrogenase
LANLGMRAMVMERPGSPLVAEWLELPEPGLGQVRIDIEACGVGRTDLHVLDGELDHPKLPPILGHEIVGRVAELGPGAQGIQRGQRVGVPSLATSVAIAQTASAAAKTCATPLDPATYTTPRYSRSAWIG